MLSKSGGDLPAVHHHYGTDKEDVIDHVRHVGHREIVDAEALGRDALRLPACGCLKSCAWSLTCRLVAEPVAA